MPRYFVQPTDEQLVVMERAQGIRVRLFAERIEQKQIAKILGVPASYLSIILNGRAVFSSTNALLDRIEQEIERILEERRAEAA